MNSRFAIQNAIDGFVTQIGLPRAGLAAALLGGAIGSILGFRVTSWWLGRRGARHRA